MKFLLDNNLPPALARALNELSKSDGHIVVPLKDKFPANACDILWIETLQNESGWAVISQDKFTKGDIERQVFRECGLPIFCLAKQWGQETYWSKAHNLVRWWPAIVCQAELISGGATFRIPWRFFSAGKIEQMRM